MKQILALIAIALLCTACAGGTAPSNSTASGITMYGTIDQGIAIHN